MRDTWDAWLSRLERDSSLLEPKRLRQRMEVLDHLESHPAWDRRKALMATLPGPRRR